MMRMALSCSWAGVTPQLVFNRGSTKMNKEVAQPHPVIMCCTGGANVGTVSPA